MASLPARFACGFCQERGRWPDLCPGDPPDEFCLEEIVFRHDLGDHRRCAPTDCDGYVLISEVASRGAAHCRATGSPLAAVNTYADPWEVSGFTSLQQAKPYRSRVGKANGARWSFEFKSRVFVVRADGSVV